MIAVLEVSTALHTLALQAEANVALWIGIAWAYPFDIAVRHASSSWEKTNMDVPEGKNCVCENVRPVVVTDIEPAPGVKNEESIAPKPEQDIDALP